MPETIDIDQLRRLRAEASDGPVLVVWGPHTFELPATAQDIAIDVIDAIQKDDPQTALRLMFGKAQWKKFKALEPTIGDITDMFAALFNRYGLGESGASPSS